MRSFGSVSTAKLQDLRRYEEQVSLSCLGSGWSLKSLERELTLEHSRVVVIREKPRCLPVALMVYWVLADGLELINMHTLPSCRRCGLGRAMLQYLQADCVSLRRDAIFLDVRSSNEPALGLYESMGFYQVGRRKGYYDGGAEDALLMRWEPLAEEAPDR